MEKIIISEATKDDVVFIFTCIQDLARHVGQLDYFSATIEGIQSEIIDSKSNIKVFIASVENEKVGFVLYFTTFSTFRAQKGLYIGDLYVLPEFRRNDVGRKLFEHVAREAQIRNCCRVEWYVTNNNINAIYFYEKLGAKKLSSKSIYSIDVT